MKILITGSTGFVGKNWLEFCTKYSFHYTQKILSRNQLSSEENTFSKYFRDIDAVLHFAGKAHDIKNISIPEEYYQINTELTKRLFDNFLQSDAKIFIFISSIKAIADRYDGIVTEEILPNPLTDYGKSKLYAENYILSKQIPTGKFIYILRPCMIHGPGNKGNLNLLYQFVQRGIPYPLAAFDNQRSFLSVENLCFVIASLLERNDIPSGVYHVADDEPLSTSEVVRMIAETIGKKQKQFSLPIGLIRILARVGDYLYLPFNTERLTKLTESYVVSNEKLIKALGKSLPVSSREGLATTIRSFNYVD